MNHYKYFDNSKYPPATILFECNAVDILEAHKKLEHEKELIRLSVHGSGVK